jgi:phenylacetate-coenzyme A ligase PaaK-like adenylate-forming protein
VLIPGIRSRGLVRVFAEGDRADGMLAEVLKFEPQAMAGTLAQLEAMAAAGITLSHAIVVMGRCGDARVTEEDRERLWSRFRVPVFEQIIAEDGGLLAAECEAHEGLHIESDALTVNAGDVNGSACACGRTTPRLVFAQEARGMLKNVATQAR